MANRVISIDIGQDKTRICEIEYKKKHPKVYNLLSFQTPPDVIVDGYIQDKQTFAAIVKEKLEEAGIKNTNVVFTISSTRIANREVTIPAVKENRIRDVVSANASDYFPIDVNQYNITYLVLKRIETEEEKGIRLLVLAAPTDLIATYYELADLMGLTIKAMDYVGNSSFQVLKTQEEDKVKMVLQLNDGNTIIHLLEKDSLLLQRTLPYGANMIAQAAISNPVLGVENYQDAKERLQTEQLINPQFRTVEEDMSLFTASTEMNDDRYQLERAKEDITSSIKVLTANINRVINYFTTKLPEKRIEEIVVAGEAALFLNFASLIQNEIGIPTTVVENLPNVTFASPVGKEQVAYISCIGAVIAPLDFVPKEVLMKEAGERTYQFPLIMLGICIAGSFLIFLSSYLLYRESESDKKRLNEKIEAIADIETIYSDCKTSETELEGISKINGLTKNVSESMLAFLSELERKTPKGCSVRSMQLNGNQLTMQIVAPDKAVCAKYIEMLKSVSQIEKVTSQGYSEESQATEQGRVTFTAVCTFKQEG